MKKLIVAGVSAVFMCSGINASKVDWVADVGSTELPVIVSSDVTKLLDACKGKVVGGIDDLLGSNPGITGTALFASATAMQEAGFLDGTKSIKGEEWKEKIRSVASKHGLLKAPIRHGTKGDATTKLKQRKALAQVYAGAVTYARSGECRFSSPLTSVSAVDVDELQLMVDSNTNTTDTQETNGAMVVVAPFPRGSTDGT